MSDQVEQYVLEPGETCKPHYMEKKKLHVGKLEPFCIKCTDGHENPHPGHRTTCIPINDIGVIPTTESTLESNVNNTLQEYSTMIGTTIMGANDTVPETTGISPYTNATTMVDNDTVPETPGISAYTNTTMVDNDTVPETTGISPYTSPVLPYTTVNGSESQDGNSGGDHTSLIVGISIACFILVVVVGFLVWRYSSKILKKLKKCTGRNIDEGSDESDLEAPGSGEYVDLIRNTGGDESNLEAPGSREFEELIGDTVDSREERIQETTV